MRYAAHAVLVATVGLLAVGEAAADAGTAIIVRTYTQPGSERDMHFARPAARAILHRAGIDVAWLECAPPGSPDACSEPLRSNELVVRIVAATTPDTHAHADTLGVAHVDVDAGSGTLATVYTDRVALMAARARIDAAELLGKAIAHEVGHLLLGTNAHGSKGLMRASWSGADLRRDRAADWLFGDSEAEAMGRSVAMRREPREPRLDPLTGRR